MQNWVHLFPDLFDDDNMPIDSKEFMEFLMLYLSMV